MVLLNDGKRFGDGIGAAPGLQIHWTGLIVEENLYDAIGAGAVLFHFADVADVADVHFAMQFLWSGIPVRVLAQVIVDPGVLIDLVIYPLYAGPRMA